MTFDFQFKFCKQCGTLLRWDEEKKKEYCEECQELRKNSGYEADYE